MRARLWALQQERPLPSLPPAGLVSLSPPPDWPAGFAEAIGWIEAGPVLLRLDVAERVGAELAWAARRGPVALPAGLASRFSVKPELLPVILRRLGVRVMPAAGLAADQYGPPAPATILPPRRKRPVATPEIAPRRSGPCAARWRPRTAPGKTRIGSVSTNGCGARGS